MFFSYGQCKDDRFPVHWHYNNHTISTDQGWNLERIDQDLYLYKGYTDHYDLKTILRDIEESVEWPTGNFCIFKIHTKTNTISVIHSRYRTFPIWISEDGGIENLCKKNKKIYADSRVTIGPDGEITTSRQPVIGSWKNLPTLTRQQAIYQIDNLLQKKFQAFLNHNKLPIKIFLTGGIDTTLMYAYLKKFTKDFEILFNTHRDHDWFYMRNTGALSKHIAYRLQHWFDDDVVVLSGRPGDEYCLRGNASLISMILMGENIEPVSWLSDPKLKSCLHYDFLQRHIETVIQSCQDPELIKVAKHKDTLNHGILDRNLNDHQVWHYGRTLTWTPLHDLDITRILLSLPFEDKVSQFMDSSICIDLIRLIDPDLTEILSEKKNHGDIFNNIVKLLPDCHQPRSVYLDHAA
jgi:hypothetical protein